MTIVRTLGVMAAGALLATACQEDAPTPTAPAEPAAGVAIAPDAAPTGDEACPCWSERTLAIAFTEAAFFFDHREADGFRPGLSLQSVDHESATILEAWVEYDAAADDPAARSCRLATVGQDGLVEELAAAGDLSATAEAACSTSLLAQAATSGFLASGTEAPAE